MIKLGDSVLFLDPGQCGHILRVLNVHVVSLNWLLGQVCEEFVHDFVGM